MRRVYAISKEYACYWQAGVYAYKTDAQAYVDDANDAYYKQIAQVKGEDFAMPPAKERVFQVMEIDFYDGQQVADFSLRVDEFGKEFESAQAGKITITTPHSYSLEELDERLAEEEQEQEENNKSKYLQIAHLIDCVVRVKWLDSRYIGRWTEVKDFHPTPVKVETWGVLVNVTDKCIAVAANYADIDRGEDNPEQMNGIMVIPFGCIEDVRQIIYEEEDDV